MQARSAGKEHEVVRSLLAAKKGRNPVSTGMTPPSTTIVLIHGLWMTPLAWEHWVERYEAQGCTVLTPGYPGIGQDEAVSARSGETPTSWPGSASARSWTT